MAREELNLVVDFTDKSFNENEDFEIMQGGGYYNITCLLKNGGVNVTSNEEVKLYAVTSDSLDYFKSVIFVNSYDISNSNVIILSDEDKQKLFNTKGYCQLIFAIGEEASLPFNYYVIDNPTYNLIKHTTI